MLWGISCTTEPQENSTDEGFPVQVRLPAEPDNLNPLITTSLYSRIVHENIFLPLMQFNFESLKLEPVLVKSAPTITSISDGPYAGGMALTYELRENARWDNGDPVTTDDVLFSLKAMFNPLVKSGAFRAYLDMIRDMKIDTDNPRKFTIYTNEQYILTEPAVSNITILPRYNYDSSGLMNDIALDQLTNPKKAEDWANTDANIQEFASQFNDVKFGREIDNIIGNGPYRLTGWDSGQKLTLERKENWWGDEVKDISALDAYPQNLVFQIIGDQNTTIAALKDLSIDVASQLDAKDYTDLLQNELLKENYNFHNPLTLQLYYIGINNKSPKLEDKRVRRALAHIIDVDDIIESLYFGLGQRTVGPFNPRKEYYDTSLTPIDYNIEKAKSLLKEAGWEDTNGNGIVDKMIGGELTEMELTYLTTPTSKFSRNLGLILEDNAPKAGIKVIIEAKEFRSLIEDLKKREYELNGGAMGQQPIPDDPKQHWHTSSDTPNGSNRVGFGNAVTDSLIDQIRVTMDETKRNELYKEFQQIVYDEQPMIFLFSPQERILINKKFDAKPSVMSPGFQPSHFKLNQDN
ncbi:MAG: peptide-binding protein [Saprospiraceae bacterium]|nr:MAG: peptide-binding protein [Saprospiraceae bacterium]